MEHSTSELKFRRGDASAEDIQDVIDTVLVELTDNRSDAFRAALAAGLTPEELDGIEIRVEEDGHGLDPITAAIVIGIATHAGSNVVDSLWDGVIWPRVRARLGARTLGEPTSSGASGPAAPSGQPSS